VGAKKVFKPYLMNIVFVYIEAFHEALKHNIKFVVGCKLLSNDWLKDYANYSVHSARSFKDLKGIN
jgi:hypothetical protein